MHTRIPSCKSRGVTPLLFSALVLSGPLHGEERIGLVGEVQSGYLLGGAREGEWIEAESARKRVSSGLKFRTYALDGPTRRAPITAKLVPGREPSPETALLDFASDDARSDPVLAVSCPWNPAPRKIQVCDPDNKTYQDAAAEVLKAAGVADPRVQVNQILRVDLDGDGEEEAIVSANTFAPRPPDDDHPEIKPLPFHAPGGFHSLVFVRRLVGDTVQTTVLAQEIAHRSKGREAMPVTRQVVAILDLNGDGRMEVVISGRYYEGDWLDVFDIEGLAVRKVLSVGSGA